MLKKFITISPAILLLLSAISGQMSDIVLCLVMVFWMISWWIFEITPLGVTALIPMIYLPLFNIIDIKNVAPNYSNPVIYLFLGGFIIARALEKTGLNQRIALVILKTTGKSDKGIVLGFIIATAFLSMWVSNTATTVMMVPIALSVLNFLKSSLDTIDKESQNSLNRMSIALMLAIAYAANIGGVMTPIGTPPNVVFVGYLDELYKTKVDFYKWFLICAPSAMTILACMFWLLTKMFPFSVAIDEKFKSFVKRKISELGPINSAERVTMSIFCMTAFLWVFKGLIHYLIGATFLNDTSIAIMGGFLLFVVPKDKNWKPVLRFKDISKLPWNIVLLFGGGMAMAFSLKEVGLIELVTESFTNLHFSHVYWMVFLLAFMTLFLTEVMSNVALCVVALPVIMEIGVSLGLSPIAVGLPSALCASFAFSMPISTPPNAIVFGTELVSVKNMMKAGLILNVLSVIVVMTLSWFLMKWLI